MLGFRWSGGAFKPEAVSFFSGHFYWFTLVAQGLVGQGEAKLASGGIFPPGGVDTVRKR